MNYSKHSQSKVSCWVEFVPTALLSYSTLFTLTILSYCNDSSSDFLLHWSDVGVCLKSRLKCICLFWGVRSAALSFVSGLNCPESLRVSRSIENNTHSGLWSRSNIENNRDCTKTLRQNGWAHFRRGTLTLLTLTVPEVAFILWILYLHWTFYKQCMYLLTSCCVDKGTSNIYLCPDMRSNCCLQVSKVCPMEPVNITRCVHQQMTSITPQILKLCSCWTARKPHLSWSLRNQLPLALGTGSENISLKPIGTFKWNETCLATTKQPWSLGLTSSGKD